MTTNDEPVAISEDARARAAEIGKVLCSALPLKQSLADLGDPAPDSPYAQERGTWSDDSGKQATLRAFYLADLWQFNAAMLLDGMGYLFKAGAVLIAPPLPLARSVLEFSARTVHLLDPEIDPFRRGKRAIIEEAYSTDAMRTAAERMFSDQSDDYRALRTRSSQLRKEATTLSSSAVVGNPDQWELDGERMAKPSEIVEELGHLHSSGRVMLGVYDQLSAFVHPGLGATLYLTADDEGTATGGAGASIRDAATVAQNALGPFYTATRRLATFAGWDPPGLEAFEDSLSAVFPGIFESADPTQ
jgi:hypothetical protein